MRISEEFRRNALDCIRLARSASDPDERALLLNLAQRWVGFAEQVRMLPSVDDAAEWSDMPLAADREMLDEHRRNAD